MIKNILSSQKGFAPALVFVILATFGITSLGTANAANNSKPGDLLFGLDKAIEEIQVALSTNDQSKAKIRLEIAKERLEELEELVQENQPIDPAVTESQLAISNATSTLSDVETKFKENKITLTSTDLQALLQELQAILTTHQGLIKKIEIKIKDGNIKAKIKLFEQEASDSAKLIDDDLDDLEDDGQLNGSIAQILEIELKGFISQVDSLFQITSGGKTYILIPSPGIDLASFAGKLVELEGYAQNATPEEVTVTKIELEDEIEDEEDELEVEGPPEVEAKGFIRQSGGGFTLTFNGKTILYYLTSSKVNLASFVNQFVEVEGILSGNLLNVLEVEAKKTDPSGNPVTPALSTSELSEKKTDTEDDEEEEDKEDESESSEDEEEDESEDEEDED